MSPDIIERMRAYGGSFARAIAEAYIVADPANRARLEQAFGDLFKKYEVNA